MAYDLSGKLVVAVSSRALFDMSDPNRIFETRGEVPYMKHQWRKRDVPLGKGDAFPFIERLLKLNEYSKNPFVEVVVLSKNDPESGLMIFNSCKHYGLDISRGVFTSGRDPYEYMKAFNACLFLSANKDDVDHAIEQGLPAGLILHTKTPRDQETNELRIAFDFDGVIADDESEKQYADGQLEAFQQYEITNRDVPHGAGPLRTLISKLAEFQQYERFESLKNKDYAPVLRISIVTARNAPAHERMIKTLRSMGLHAVEAFFLGGVSKKEVLSILKPHIFFDDQRGHVEPASDVVPSVHIPFGVKNIKVDG